MSIKAYITSESRTATFDGSFNVTKYSFDRGFTFVDDGVIINNNISMSISEAPEGVIAGVDHYGRIIGKIPVSATPTSLIKLVITYNGNEFVCENTILAFRNFNIGEALDFDPVQDAETPIHVN